MRLDGTSPYIGVAISETSQSKGLRQDSPATACWHAQNFKVWLYPLKPNRRSFHSWARRPIAKAYARSYHTVCLLRLRGFPGFGEKKGNLLVTKQKRKDNHWWDITGFYTVFIQERHTPENPGQSHTVSVHSGARSKCPSSVGGGTPSFCVRGQVAVPFAICSVCVFIKNSKYKQS